jgi:hypothetical protein
MSLGLALHTEFRLLVQLCWRKLLQYTGWPKFQRMRFGLGRRADSLVESIDRERKRRTRYGYKKWKAGF